MRQTILCVLTCVNKYVTEGYRIGPFKDYVRTQQKTECFATKKSKQNICVGKMCRQTDKQVKFRSF